MKKFVIAAALGATMLTGVAQAAQQDSAPPRSPGPMAMLDADKDGVITREEATAAADRQFERMDRNRDGKLDAAEQRPPHRRGPGGRGGPDGKAPPPPPPGAVTPLQTDRDGRVDRPARGPRGGGMRMHLLAGADANRDGTIDRAEFRAAMLGHFERMDANRDGRIDAAERQAMMAHGPEHGGPRPDAPDAPDGPPPPDGADD